MNNSTDQICIKDRGGMRSGMDRRQQVDIGHRPGPERRSGKDRRSGFDRRSSLGRKRDFHRGAVERRDAFRRCLLEKE